MSGRALGKHQRRCAPVLTALVAAAVVTEPIRPATARPIDCHGHIAPIATLWLERFYTDRSGSKINHAVRDRNRAQTRPLKAMLNAVAKDADRAVLWQDSRAASCGLARLKSWAAAKALTGPMGSKQGEHHRKWALTGFALAYLKLARFADDAAHRKISGWLQDMADDASNVFNNRGIKRNNHWIWLGLGLATVGLATGSDAHWQAGLAIRNKALAGIRSDGALPLELARGRLALHYHVFATTPIVILDWLASAHGAPASPQAQTARNRLIALTLTGLTKPERFAELTGQAQDLKQRHKWPAGYGWPALIGRLPSPPAKVMDHRMPRYANAHRWIGGDVRALIRAVNLTSQRR